MVARFVLLAALLVDVDITAAGVSTVETTPLPAPPSVPCLWDPSNATTVTTGTAPLTCSVSAGRGTLAVSVGSAEWTGEGKLQLVDTVAMAYRSDEVLPKGRLKVAAITIGFGGGDTFNTTYVAERLALAVEKLRAAKAAGVTLALLPEEFCGVGPVALENSTILSTLAAAAKELSMHIAFGIRLRAPPGDQYKNANGYNTAVLLDPNGAVVGRYKKQWPCCVAPDGTVGNDGNPSRDGAQAWDIEGIGRVGFLTCYDANFAESWHALYAARVDLVLWPSAYGGGMPLRAYAALYHFAIVPAGWGDITDQTGRVAADLSQPSADVFVATLDLDKTYVHTDFDSGEVDALLSAHAGDVELETIDEYCAGVGKCASQADLVAQSNFRLLRRTDAGYAKGVTVRGLLAQYKIRDLRTYQLQARAAINEQRQRAAP